MGSQTIRVLIVDDHVMVRAGIKILLDESEDIRVIGEAPNGLKAIELVEQLDPDVVLMDLNMPVMDGIDAIKKIVALRPKQRIIVLTGMLDDERLFQAIQAGAQGCVEKTTQPEELVQSIRDVNLGKPSLSSWIAWRVLRDISNPPSPRQPKNRLSDRETQILRLMTQGKLDQEIAQELVLTEVTIRTHISRILTKLGLENRVQAALGASDVPTAHALQDQFTITPLSVYQGEAAPASVPGVPKADPRVTDELKWWEKFRVALAAFPPPPANAPFVALCEKFGLTAAESPYIDPNPALEQILVLGQKAAEDKLEELLKTAIKRVNGWQNSIHVFDYNLDYFEIGALDEPQWKVADRKMAYVLRAVAARAGLFGNHGYEANYQMVYFDADDQLLESDHRYELHLAQLPPVDAFWSLTMYDAHEFYLVANPINRFAIGDRTPGLKYGEDGSLTIYMQKDSPGPDKESNWLPTPQTGAFRPIMRMYQPKEPIMNGTYLLPAIKCVG